MDLLTAAGRQALGLACAALPVVAGLLWLTAPAEAQIDESRFDQIKAAFVYKMTRYVEWQEEAMPGEDEAMRVAVMGERRIARVLDALLENKSYEDRPFEVVRTDEMDEALTCHLVFVGDDYEEDYQDRREAFESAGILTVADWGEFTREGGIVRLYRRENKLAFEINLGAAERSGIKFSSQLLRLASIVEENDAEETDSKG